MPFLRIFEQWDSSHSQTLPHPNYAEPISEGEEDKNMDVAPVKDEYRHTGLSGEEVMAAVAYREEMLKEAHAKELVNEKKPEQKNASLAIEAGNEGKEADERTAFLRGRKTQESTRKMRALSIDPLAPSLTFGTEA
ncbi:hypothetical protein ARMGADRAFT_1030430 [Armillaria gallica]|uniref:Uncharacterized protein n=1 Tax=Armillaria gallica TaxID=47427 RepID=A0A2H3DCK5_ARMGA|nr:hypothetical protein ARMGADRAFT_1030430 [Armillaria gallica]